MDFDNIYENVPTEQKTALKAFRAEHPLKKRDCKRDKLDISHSRKW